VDKQPDCLKKIKHCPYGCDKTFIEEIKYTSTFRVSSRNDGLDFFISFATN
jgi:hypothetical protein